MKVCAEPRCSNLTNTTRCERHRKERRRRQDSVRPSAAQRGYGKRWRQFRARFLRDHPICGWHEGCLNSATDVHHLDGLGPKGPRGFDPYNCLQLCAAHHAQITSRDQPGGWNTGVGWPE